jgi:subtilase family serine protease
MGRVTLRRLALLVGGTGVVVALGASTATANQARHVLPGSKPEWTSSVAQTGTVPAGQRLAAKVWLAPRNAAQLTTLAQAVSDPASAQYQQFITADQYRAQFAPTSAQVATVSQWLTSSGLTVDQVGPDGHYLAVSGSASAVESAFAAQIGTYVVNSKPERAPASDLSVPDNVAASVLAVSGLATFGHRVQANDLGAPDGFVNGDQCSSYYGQKVATDQPSFAGGSVPYAVCGYTPSQLRGTYGVAKGLGSGQTVAITDAFHADTLEADANTYATNHGDPAFASGQFDSSRSFTEPPADSTLVSDCGGNGWYGEQALDVEAVHAMATSANVMYYGATSCYDDDLLAALSRIVSDNHASIVTNSWGEPIYYVGTDHHVHSTLDANLINAYETVFQQGAAQGIGFYFSSGDNGDEKANTGVTFPDYPASDPWVTAVGGTSLAVGSDNKRKFETGWGTAKWGLDKMGKHWTSIAKFLYGAGGGDAAGVFSRPSYQIGVVQDGSNGRAVPDIGLDADPTTGMLVGETQSFPLASRYGAAGTHYGEYRIGGTSLASPLMAGVSAAFQGTQGKRTGFANPWIYSLARQGAFYDVTPQGDAGNVRQDFANGINGDNGVIYTLRTFDEDSSLTTGPGWDNVSGVGSVIFKNLKPLRGH